MDNIDLLRELNKATIKKDEFELALERSGFDLPPEDEMEDEMGGEMDAEMGDEMDDIDSDGEEGYTSDIGIEDDELQEIVDWCEEECPDMSDEELDETLRDELEELDIDPEQLDAAIDRVMTMLGRASEEEDMDSEMDAGMDDEMDDEMGGEESMDDEAYPEEEEYGVMDADGLEFDPETDFRDEADEEPEFEIDPEKHFRDDKEPAFRVDPRKRFRDYRKGRDY